MLVEELLITMVILPTSGDRDDVVDLPMVLQVEVQPAPGAFGPLHTSDNYPYRHRAQFLELILAGV